MPEKMKMKTYSVLLSAFALLLSVAAANAGEVQGTIRSVNPQAASIVLDNGKQFRMGEGVSLKDLKPGMKVSVTFKSTSGADEDDGGGLIATQITVAPKG
jgi:hypothetical protein